MEECTLYDSEAKEVADWQYWLQKAMSEYSAAAADAAAKLLQSCLTLGCCK